MLFGGRQEVPLWILLAMLVLSQLLFFGFLLINSVDRREEPRRVYVDHVQAVQQPSHKGVTDETTGYAP